MLSPQSYFSLYIRKDIKCLGVGLLGIGQVVSVSCKSVCRWVTTNCCCTSGILNKAISSYTIPVTCKYCSPTIKIEWLNLWRTYTFLLLLQFESNQNAARVNALDK
jgi:hypothetical protein